MIPLSNRLRCGIRMTTEHRVRMGVTFIPLLGRAARKEKQC